MAKESGLGITTLSVDDSAGSAVAIKNDITNFEFSTPRGVQDVTGVDKSAFERLLLLADFSLTLNGVFNDEASKSHLTLRTISSSSTVRQVTIAHSGNSLVNECIFTDYALTRSEDGALTWTTPAVLADGTVPTWT